jgi:glycine cleavage system T protein
VAKNGEYGIIEYKIGAGLKFLAMTEAKKTVLFDRHAALAAKSQIVPFAGWEMPLWYQSISAEHGAVRKTAGLFDCTHMAVLEITGKDALNFLNILTTNDVSMLKPGKAQYSYILDLLGNIIDDVIIYCISSDPLRCNRTAASNYMMVVNAANEDSVKNWIQKVRTDFGELSRAEKSLIDNNWQFEVRDFKDPSLPDARVDIALQGPASAECLKNIFGADFGKLKSFTFTSIKTKDLNLIISRTGYTGAKVGFEIFVHPAKAPMLWDTILEKGKNLGIIPCGLGARDSLRIEAGLPLYGHELDGEFNISPFQAGYSWAVKLQKPGFTPTPICAGEANLESAEKATSAQSFSAQPQSKLVRGFIGKEAILKKSDNWQTEVARLKFDAGAGIRPIRQFDGILKASGECIGHVLSCAKVDDRQIVLALIEKQYNIIGSPAGVYYVARNISHIQQGRKEKVKAGDKLDADIVGKVAERFEKF